MTGLILHRPGIFGFKDIKEPLPTRLCAAQMCLSLKMSGAMKEENQITMAKVNQL